MEIAYEPHPVSPNRKAELRAAGFKIVDIRFKPEIIIEPQEPARRGRPRKIEAE